MEAEAIPAPPLFMDIIQWQWASLGVFPSPTSFDKNFYNMVLDLTKFLQTPEVDEPVAALKSSFATLT